VSWSDSGARTGPHEIGLIAKIAARNDDDAARRLYRKYRMELFRFGVHVLRDRGLAEEMVQETFIRFCQQARNYNADRGPVPWVPQMKMTSSTRKPDLSWENRSRTAKRRVSRTDHPRRSQACTG